MYSIKLGHSVAGIIEVLVNSTSFIPYTKKTTATARVTASLRRFMAVSAQGGRLSGREVEDLLVGDCSTPIGHGHGKVEPGH